jgi:GMP synthase-like glutamine amidotransferase
MFSSLFAMHNPLVTLKFYDIQKGQYPKSLDECHGYISTGSRFSVYDNLKWVTEFSDFVRLLYQCEKKFVGICFGHQMIAHALGGKVEKSTTGWEVGIKRVNIFERAGWMSPELDYYDLPVSHQDQVADLPKGSCLLGTNPFSKYSMYMVGKSALGIQAHPEIPPEYLKVLLSARKERIGKEKIEKAYKTLNRKTHQKVIVEWITRFLQ